MSTTTNNAISTEGFRVNDKIRRQLARRKRRCERRLKPVKLGDTSQPVLTAANIQLEIAERTQAIGYGGLAPMQLLVKRLGLADEINQHLHLLQSHRPYHESDHVLNLAFNALCDGRCLEDLERLRNDEAYLDALGAQRIADPTTAGDFCRRFDEHHIRSLQEVFHRTRQKVWAEQPAEFFNVARIDMDGTLVATTGQCKQGMDIAYNGVWGYHPLIVSLANTGEILSIVNRAGNRPSHEGAHLEVDRVLQVCFDGGFQQVRLRGDTDFSQTQYLDRWSDDARVRFIFGLDHSAGRHVLSDDLPESAWKPLQRPPRYAVQTKPRARPENVKERIVAERLYANIRLESEEVAEFEYRPAACRKTYRCVVLRKNLQCRERGQTRLFEDYRYFFYLTNDREHRADEIVFEANDRCDQENLHAQLKGGVRSLTAPVDTLLSNWAYMVMTSLAWNLKAWLALSLPETGRHKLQHQTEKRSLLRMEFRTFVNALIRLPCQIVRSGRRLVYRLLSWNRWQPVLFRVVDALREPLRC
jgi:hypothetical protein